MWCLRNLERPPKRLPSTSFFEFCTTPPDRTCRPLSWINSLLPFEFPTVHQPCQKSKGSLAKDCTSSFSTWYTPQIPFLTRKSNTSVYFLKLYPIFGMLHSSSFHLGRDKIAAKVELVVLKWFGEPLSRTDYWISLRKYIKHHITQCGTQKWFPLCFHWSDGGPFKQMFMKALSFHFQSKEGGELRLQKFSSDAEISANLYKLLMGSKLYSSISK